MAPSRKYRPLLDSLDALPADQDTVSFTFAELETLLGAALPPSALFMHYWDGSTVARYNWGFAGFRARLDRLRLTVTFTRRTARNRVQQ